MKGRRSHVVAAGSVHPSGRRYRSAPGRGLGEIEIAKAPKWVLARIQRPRPQVEKASHLRGDARPRSTTAIGRVANYGENALESELAQLRCTTEGGRNIALNNSAFVLGQLCGAGALDERRIRVELSKTAKEIGLTPDEAAKTIESGMATGRAMPRDLAHLEGNVAKLRVHNTVSDDPLAEALASLGETDADNAHRFARRFCHEVAYVPAVGFHVWNGRFWERAAETAAVLRAEASARAIAEEVRYLNDPKAQDRRLNFVQASLSRAALERAVALARGHLEVPATTFDAQPNLLPVANGTIDLKTGAFGPHDPAHYLTRMVPIDYDPVARCPVFLRFLKDRVGDEEVIAFLQKAVGLSLTGNVGEQVLFFLLGEGRSGKSTFVNLLQELLGSFAIHTPIETFTTKTFETIRTDLARMMGARVVTAGEIHPSQQFDEALIKGMTGGDPITARFMRQDLFQYMPQFKIWLYANHAPKVRATDDAFWRRMRVIRFDNVVPEHKVEKDLPHQLRAELPGILNWALAGCLAWRGRGLKPPAAVTEATLAWRHGADHVARYLRERTVPAAGKLLAAADLLNDFQTWCTAAGEKAVSSSEFKKRVIALGWQAKKTKKGSMWVGLRLKS